MINYFLPPLGGIASLRAWRFATLLPETGWEPTLVSPGRGDYVADGALTIPPHRVVRTGSVELSRLIRRPVRRLEGLTEGAGTERRRLIDVARHAIRRWVYRPDAQIGWYPFALAAARRVVRQSDVRAIFSSAFPITAHLVARRLHRETGIPWVAEFRDLWSDWGNGSRRQKWDEALERSLLEEAAAAVTVSPTYAEVLAARGGGRVDVLTNAFDPEDFQGAPALVQDTVAHLGTYYAGRQDLETVIEALGGLVGSGALPAARLRFIGECPRSLLPAIHRVGLADKVDESGFVPHQEAVAQLARSRVLAFGGPVSCDSPALKGNVAAKVFEYLGSRRPVLMVGHPESDVARMLRPFPQVAIVPTGDVPGARRALVRLWENERSPDPSLLQPYTSRHVSRLLGRVLDSVCE